MQAVADAERAADMQLVSDAMRNAAEEEAREQAAKEQRKEEQRRYRWGLQATLQGYQWHSGGQHPLETAEEQRH